MKCLQSCLESEFNEIEKSHVTLCRRSFKRNLENVNFHVTMEGGSIDADLDQDVQDLTRSCSHDEVNLVYEKDDLAVGIVNLLEHGLHANHARVSQVSASESCLRENIRFASPRARTEMSDCVGK